MEIYLKPLQLVLHAANACVDIYDSTFYTKHLTQTLHTLEFNDIVGCVKGLTDNTCYIRARGV